MTRVPDWLQRRALTHGDQTALEFEGVEVSFAALQRRAAIYDQALCERRLGTGDVVATLLHNRTELVALAHGAPRHGRAFAPLGVRLTAVEVAAMLNACAARLLICEEATRHVAATAAGRAGVDCVGIDDLAVEDTVQSTESSTSIDLDTTHSVVFTSGTSGTPKGVRLTWGNHLWSAMGSALNLGLSPADRWLCCLPLNHVGGLSILMRSVVYGHAVELHSGFSPQQTNAAIRERGVTIVSVVANMLQRMLDADGDRPYPPSLRAVLVGGGPVPASLLERCRAIGVPVLHTYGLTETASQVATARPGRGDPGVGPPLPFAEIRIAGDDGAAAPAGTAGDIEVRGPMVSPGYIGDSGRADGEWLRTRDRGWLGEGGVLHVLGRGDETVVCGGENVHPAEVERALESHPAVAEAFATGVEDARWGAVMHAAVRVDGNAGEIDLIAHCRAHLAGYKVPRRIVTVGDFPRTPAGKIARTAARRMLAEAQPEVAFSKPE